MKFFREGWRSDDVQLVYSKHDLWRHYRKGIRNFIWAYHTEYPDRPVDFGIFVFEKTAKYVMIAEPFERGPHGGPLFQELMENEGFAWCHRNMRMNVQDTARCTLAFWVLWWVTFTPVGSKRCDIPHLKLLWRIPDMPKRFHELCNLILTCDDLQLNAELPNRLASIVEGDVIVQDNVVEELINFLQSELDNVKRPTPYCSNRNLLY